MYRILKPTKSSYITNKVIAGSPCKESNLGMAGTLDLFKIVTKISDTPEEYATELSRLLIHFDYTKIIQDPYVDYEDPSFQCILRLVDVYGGQNTPSNYELVAHPIAKYWDQGVGLDVIAYRDQDAVNFITSSVSSGFPELWNTEGADSAGISTSPVGADYFTDYSATQTFSRGDEDLEMDITDIVRASLRGNLINYGLRISFTKAIENNLNTYFVKRFGSANVFNKDLAPSLIVKYNDKIEDDSGDPTMNYPIRLFVYNEINGGYTNFISGSTPIAGNGCMELHLEASHSIVYVTESYSASHKMTIEHLTKSLDSISYTFPVNQFELNGHPLDGVYYADVPALTDDPLLDGFLSGSLEHNFNLKWKSLDGTVVFAEDDLLFYKSLGTSSYVKNRNWNINITNLKRNISITENRVRLRVFVFDNEAEQFRRTVMTPRKIRSVIVKNMKWRLLKAYDRTEVIPFDDCTALSYDQDGMYFDLFVNDLDVGEVYEFELLVDDSNMKFVDGGPKYRFKVTK